MITSGVGAYKRAIEEIDDPLYVARQLEASGDSLQAFNIYKNMMNETSDPSMKHFLITSMLRVAPCMENGINDIRNIIKNELVSAKSWYKACLDFTLCNLLYREGKYSEALDAFKTKAKEYKGTPIEQEYLINIASLYGDKYGDKNTAMTYADMAAAINPGESYLRLAYEAAGVNDYIPASHEYRIVDPFTGYTDSDEPEKELVSLSEDISVTPNPFNPITTISYNISTPGHVSLSIYNITGQKVATLVNGLSTTGFHSVRFDGSSFASGVYFYRFETPKFSKSGKLLLIK